MKTILTFYLFLSVGNALGTPCGGTTTEPSIAVRASNPPTRLFLCESGNPVLDYAISIGTKGVGKKKQGDHRTPLGTYPLGDPRDSKRFHRFIPVGYPSAAQKEKGFTGSDVGIHGPPRWIAWLGQVTRFFDWTDGCIAVGTDQEIDEISQWVTKKQPASVTIE